MMYSQDDLLKELQQYLTIDYDVGYNRGWYICISCESNFSGYYLYTDGIIRSGVNTSRTSSGFWSSKENATEFFNNLVATQSVKVNL